jgi:pimeloyl-ACP methyl ester carboxylesterase
MEGQSAERVGVAGLTFEVEFAGPVGGERVLLLHGWPERGAMWRGLMGALAEQGLRCAAPDQRGYSPDARPLHVEDYRMPLLVADAAGLLDALGWDAAHVVGHDWGSMVAWHLAATARTRVRSLTAVSVPHPRAMGAALATDPDQQTRSAYIRLFREAPERAVEALLANDAAALVGVFAGSGMDEAAVRGLVAPLLEPTALLATLSWYGAASADDAKACGPVRVPTTFVWGPLDIAIGRVAAEGCAAQVAADYRFVELPGVGHWVAEQAPDALAEAVLQQIEAA